MAKKFTLKGRDLEITCTLGAGCGFPLFEYRQGSVVRYFEPHQIHIDETMLGQLVTVTLDLTVEAGTTTFTLFLPTLDIPLSESVDFATIGIYKDLRGPVIVPKRQVAEWRSVHLYGIARHLVSPAERVLA